MRDGFPNSQSDFDSPQPRRESLRPRRRLSRRFAVLIAVLAIASAFALAMHLPQELVALAQNRDRIRELQEENNDLNKRLIERRERLKNLKENFNEQELEIRRSLHLYKPGDTVFIIPPKNGEPTPATRPAN
ncbi:MAG: septum formation initiator family protein [Bryobacterales bacterium]|nr:septum formation initiator family protein [Bryobacterales bacterium]